MPMGIVVISCVRPSVQPSMGLGLCIAYKALGRNGLQFGMLMYPDGLHSAFMDAYGYCCWSVCPSICLFVRLRHFQVAVHLQRREVVIIGRWLLPSLVDTGDICCHYWQHILVYIDVIHYPYCKLKCSSSLKRKCHHFDEILITGCTGSCHFDNCQWWKFHQNADISISVMIKSSPLWLLNWVDWWPMLLINIYFMENFHDCLNVISGMYSNKCKVISIWSSVW